MAALQLALLAAAAAAQPLPPDARKARALRVPNWRPTFDMKQSTILYRCNVTGWHDPREAGLDILCAELISRGYQSGQNTHNAS